MAVKAKAQMHMDDKVVENKELENILEAREELKEKVASYRQTDKDAKDKIKSLDLPVPCRVGRFIIAKTAMEGKEISFQTQPSTRISIKLADK